MNAEPDQFHFNPGQVKAWDNLLTTTARFCLLYGGSRSGKTFLMVFTILTRALKAPGSRHLIVRQEGISAKRAIVKGTIPEVLKMCFPGLVLAWKDQLGYFILPNGAEIWVGGLNDEKAMEKILGNEYATIYINEASEVRYTAFTLLRSRLAQTVKDIEGDDLSQRFYVDLNPTTRTHWTYRVWTDGIEPETETPLDMDRYAMEVINPYDNVDNLSQEYLDDLAALPDRARKRFFEGKYVEDVENALWNRGMIRRVQQLPDLQRIVVAVDPAASTETGSDETGIIVAGIDGGGVGYVLADDSGRFSPQDWAKKALAAYRFFNADRIVAEVNNGGDMVEAVIRAQPGGQNVPYSKVHATRGKVLRAEPVAALYERGKVFHHGSFDQLEDQMCTVTIDFDRKAAGFSPDRLDAMVWAMTELFPQMTYREDDSEDFEPIGAEMFGT